MAGPRAGMSDRMGISVSLCSQFRASASFSIQKGASALHEGGGRGVGVKQGQQQLWHRQGWGRALQASCHTHSRLTDSGGRTAGVHPAHRCCPHTLLWCLEHRHRAPETQEIQSGHVHKPALVHEVAVLQPRGFACGGGAIAARRVGTTC